MKLFKRLLCGALIAALLLPAAMAAPSESSFPDTQGHWAQEQIETAVQGATRKIGDTWFSKPGIAFFYL